MTQSELSNHSTVRLISKITGILVALLATGAFALSFDALQKLAHDHGVSPGLGWIWPLILDGSIVVFSLAVLRCSLHQENSSYPMFLVICATVASVMFNMAHAPEGVLAKFMAAIPPLALFGSFELVVRQIRSEVERTARLSSLSELSSHLENLSQQRDALEGHVEQLSVRKESLTLELKQVNSPSVHESLDRANEAKGEKIRQRLDMVAQLAGQGKTPAEIATLVGMSSKTVRRDMARIKVT